MVERLQSSCWLGDVSEELQPGCSQVSGCHSRALQSTWICTKRSWINGWWYLGYLELCVAQMNGDVDGLIALKAASQPN